MKIIKTLVLASCLFLVCSQTTFATHMNGGEISYRCLNTNGLFEFTVVVYRDCGGSTAGFGNTTISLQGPHGQTTLPLISSADMTSRCATSLAFGCNPPSTGQGAHGSISKFIFRGNVNLAAVGAAPVGIGHTFWVTLPCCRSSGISNSLSVNGSQALQVKMYRYIDPSTGQTLTPAQLCDNSPNFISDPAALFIQNPNDSIYFQNFSYDLDIQDSIVFSISNPLNDQRVPFAYSFPYSINNPLPGILGPPTISTANTPINPVSGEMVFRPIITGTFVIVIQVTAYRCGQKISEVFRDFIFKIIPNPVGSPPPYVPNSNDLLHPFSQKAPILSSLAFNQNSTFFREVLTYIEADTLVIPIHVTDSFPKLTGNPTDSTTWQTSNNQIAVAVKGRQLSTLNLDSIGCDLPPCATIRTLQDPNPPQTQLTQPINVLRGNGLPLGNGYSFINSGGIKIVWTPNATQLLLSQACNVGRPNYFDFEITALDRNCPLEGQSKSILRIKLLGLPTPRPIFQLLNIVGGQKHLFFNAGIDTVNLDLVDLQFLTGTLSAQDSIVLLSKAVDRRRRAFSSLSVYKSARREGPYSVAFTTNDPLLSHWVDTSLITGQFYFLEIVGRGINDRFRSADTLGTCALGAVNLSALSDTVICPGRTLDLICNVSALNKRFKWYRYDSLMAQTNSNVFTAPSVGSYSVEVYDSSFQCFQVSNSIQITSAPAPFNEEKICAVTIDTLTNRNAIVWKKTQARTAKFHIFRESSTAGQFDSIGTVLFNSPSFYIDLAANPLVQSWRYKIQVEDSCGLRSALSPFHRSIHLVANSGVNNEVNLNWSGYEGITYTTHKVLRATTGSSFVLIGSVPSTNYSFTDVSPPSGPKAYAIEIEIPGGCDPFARANGLLSIRSNLVDVGSGVGMPWLDEHRAVVYPNPGTGLFRASWDVPALEEQELQLYNSYGQRVRTFRLQTGESALELDLQGEAPGVYVLRSKGSAWTERIVLLR